MYTTLETQDAYEALERAVKPHAPFLFEVCRPDSEVHAVFDVEELAHEVAAFHRQKVSVLHRNVQSNSFFCKDYSFDRTRHAA